MYLKSTKLLTAIIGVLIVVSCNKSENTTTDPDAENLNASASEINNVIRIDDSLAITQLIRDTHKWHLTTEGVADFDVYLVKPTDTMYGGIDAKAHQSRIASLKATGFFTNAFLDNYNKIAQTIDTVLKKGTTTYHVGELPPYGNDADPWTNTQDYPDNYWKKMKVFNLAYANETATCLWEFNDNTIDSKDFSYKCRLKKVNNSWKIDWLEGFDFKPFTEGLNIKY